MATEQALPEHLRKCLCRVYDSLQELDALSVCASTDPAQQRALYAHVNLYAQQACDSLTQLARTVPAVARGLQAHGIETAPALVAPRHEPGTLLFVDNLPLHVDDTRLRALFAAFSPVDAHVVRNSNGQSKGCGLVRLANVARYQYALRAMHEFELDGRALVVRPALDWTVTHM